MTKIVYELFVSSKVKISCNLVAIGAVNVRELTISWAQHMEYGAHFHFWLPLFFHYSKKVPLYC